MESEIAFPLGWMLALLVALVAGISAMRKDARERVRERAIRASAAARRDVALGMMGDIEDGEVREAWPVIAAVLAERSLADGDDVRGLITALTAGSGRQLAEEVAIDVSDESRERVSLYHMGFVPHTVTCPRDALVKALEQLAKELDALDALARE